MDLAAPEGSPIYAVTDGEVVEVNEEAMNIDGNHVMHTLPDGTIIYYGHMRDVPLVKKGDKGQKRPTYRICWTNGCSYWTTYSL